MPDNLSGGGGSDDGDAGIPGKLSLLLRELARASADGLHAAWEQRLQPGDTVGRFEILREIGRGGFGVVYEALDGQLGRSVAFKTLRPVRSGHELSAEWILNEAEAVARLDHPAIVTLYDVGRCDSGPYLVEEMLRGETLEQRLRRGALPVREVLAIGVELARGLGHAHGRGVLHRDLKPGNVFLTEDGRVKLLDFGLAHLLGTRGLPGAGTPAYMAPEQLLGEPVDARTDVFALGATLFEALSGKPPFPLKDGRSAALDRGSPPALAQGTSEPLAALLGRCLSREPSSRPASGQAVAEQLLALQPVVDRARDRSRVKRALRRPALVLALLAASSGLVVTGVMGVGSRGQGPPLPTRSDGRIAVAVADFANETGERELDALSGLLITSLEQSRKLSVLTRSRVLDLAAQAGHHAETRIDERLAREVGRTAGVRALILATIHRFGTAYAVDLRAVDPEKDTYLFALTERASRKEEIPGLIDRIGDRARRALREDETAIRVSRVEVGKAVTASLEAYEHYLRGMDFWDDCDDAEAVRAFQQALSIDADMALAHMMLAVMAEEGNGGGLDAAPHLAAAARAAPALPAKERRLVQGVVAAYSGRPAEAVDVLRGLAADYPQDKLAALFAAFAMYDASRANSPAVRLEAHALLRRAVDLDPSFVWPLFLLFVDGAATGEVRALLPLAQRAAEVRPRSGTWQNLSLVRGVAGDVPGALEAARRSKSASSRTNATGSQTLAYALAADGRLDDALGEIAPWTAMEVPDATRYLMTATRLGLEVRGGRRRAALRSFDESVAIRPLPRAGPGALAEVHLLAGDVTRAREILSAWSDPPPSAAALLEASGLSERAARLAAALPRGDEDEALYRAQVARRQGRRQEAVDLASQAVASRPGTHLSYVKGMALSEADRCGEAVPEFDRVARAYAPTVIASAYVGPALLEASKCLERLRRPREAIERLDRLLALWSRADADLPALVEAKALRRRLAAAARAD